MVEEEDAVEVVDLVLDGAGLEPGRLLAGPGAVAVGGLDDEPLRPAHVAGDLRVYVALDPSQPTQFAVETLTLAVFVLVTGMLFHTSGRSRRAGINP